jgi:hypothetical protein
MCKNMDTLLICFLTSKQKVQELENLQRALAFENYPNQIGYPSYDNPSYTYLAGVV